MPDFDPTKYKSEYNKSHYTQLAVRMTAAEKDRIIAAAEAAGMSLRAYILSLVPEK